MKNLLKKTHKRLAASVLLAVLCAPHAMAQGKPQMEVTLDKAIETALAENPTMKVAGQENLSHA